jgi:hypothetical protein
MDFNFVKQRFVVRLENYLSLPEANLQIAEIVDIEPLAAMARPNNGNALHGQEVVLDRD